VEKEAGGVKSACGQIVSALERASNEVVEKAILDVDITLKKGRKSRVSEWIREVQEETAELRAELR
jgi:hypothetical protein